MSMDNTRSQGIAVFDNYFDAQGAAKFLGVTRPTLYGYIQSGRLKACRLGDGPRGRLRVSRAELLRYIEGNPAFTDRQVPEDL